MPWMRNFNVGGKFIFAMALNLCAIARGSCVKPWSLLVETSRTGGMEPMVGIEPTTYGLRNRRASVTIWDMQFQQSIQKWKTLAGIGNKVSTQKYHAEIEKIILNNWTARAQKIDTVTDKQCSDFVLSVAHYSAPRFNAVMSAMRSILPGRSQHFQFRTVRVKHRDNVSQLKFQTLLTELDARPKSHAGLIVRFLSVTGLRIGAAGKLKWSDVNWEDCFIIAPGSIMKNGKPCLIPFVNGTRDVLERLQKITGD